jgi:hypothetical protein
MNLGDENTTVSTGQQSDFSTYQIWILRKYGLHGVRALVP